MEYEERVVQIKTAVQRLAFRIAIKRREPYYYALARAQITNPRASKITLLYP